MWVVCWVDDRVLVCNFQVDYQLLHRVSHFFAIIAFELVEIFLVEVYREVDEDVGVFVDMWRFGLCCWG